MRPSPGLWGNRMSRLMCMGKLCRAYRTTKLEKMKKVLKGGAKYIAMIICTVAISACGGGGDGGSKEPQANTSADSSHAVPMAVGGSVNGIDKPGLILALNGESEIRVDQDRNFVFPRLRNEGSAYHIEIQRNPTGQDCVVQDGATGTVSAELATKVSVLCRTASDISKSADGTSLIPIRGKITGLVGAGLRLTLAHGFDSPDEEIAIPSGQTDFSFMPRSPADSWAGRAPLLLGISRMPQGQFCEIRQGYAEPLSRPRTDLSVVCYSPPNEGTASSGLVLSASSVDFVAEVGQAVNAQTVTGTARGVATNVYIKVAYTNNALDTVNAQVVGLTGWMTLTPKASTALAAGQYTDTATVSVCFDQSCTRHVPGSPQTIKVNYLIKPAKPPAALVLSEHAAAFSSTPQGYRLTKTISVQDTSDTPGVWSASSDARWLAVQSISGVLTLKADPAGMPPGLYEAAVTVRPNAPSTARPTVVRVGLYVSTTTAANQVLLDSSVLSNMTAMAGKVVDPVRPYYFVSLANQILVVHAYTGQTVKAITLRDPIDTMTVSDDGEALYAAANATGKILVVDLHTMQLSDQFDSTPATNTGTSNWQSLFFVRLADHPYLLMNPSESAAIDLFTKKAVRSFSLQGDQIYALSKDSRILFHSLTMNSGEHDAPRLALQVNSLGELYAVETSRAYFGTGSGSTDLVTNVDGSRVCMANEGMHEPRCATLVNGAAGSYMANDAPPLPIGNSILRGVWNVEFNGYDSWITNVIRDFGPHELWQLDFGATQPWVVLGSENDISRLDINHIRVSSDGLRLIGDGTLAPLPQRTQ